MGRHLRALAAGRQSVILRKGGIAEEGGAFRPEHAEFLLYPTFFHEHRAGVKPEFLPLLEAAEAARPEPGTIRFSHFVRVTECGISPTSTKPSHSMRAMPGRRTWSRNASTTARRACSCSTYRCFACESPSPVPSGPSTPGARRG